ncbi:hypothetical protein P3W85_42735 [Cupriavidus basilensis]|uniref:Uncharacterized protein n=1 Tax=Cupriavidus basilensis TaxID=68895 RepID=A0ABT6B418_9BURK|nr:hypothetical protein [Cupriavidus basilensis]MDF3839611.1 hypothetical protein [Cupriavidus basilensis]
MTHSRIPVQLKREIEADLQAKGTFLPGLYLLSVADSSPVIYEFLSLASREEACEYLDSWYRQFGIPQCQLLGEGAREVLRYLVTVNTGGEIMGEDLLATERFQRDGSGSFMPVHSLIGTANISGSQPL